MISRPNFAALFSLFGLLSLLAGAAQIVQAQVPLPDPRSIVSLSSTIIDINLPEPGLPPDLLVSPDGLVDGYYLVKFSDPASASERQDLETLTDRVYTYLPYYSYLVKMPKALATSATVTSIGASWVGDYHPGYKLSPHVTQIAADGSSDRRIVMLHVYPDADLAAVEIQIAALGIDGLVGSGTGSFFSRARLLMTADEIAARRNDLARLRDVFWVDVEGRKTLHNDTTIWVGQSGTAGGGATPVFDNGIFGAGQVIGVLDTGLDPDMCYFADGLGELPAENNCDGGTAINSAHRKVLAIDFLWADDCDGTSLNKYDNQSHGTHVAGTALGDDSATPVFHDAGDGMAPAAKLVMQDGGFATDDCADLPALGCPVVDLKPFLQQAFDQGARIHTNSWGDDENNPVQRLYTTGTQDFDQFMWENKDFLLLSSAGNSGTTGVGSPSTGKNVVGVGSTLRGASADSMSSFSSHGPTDDGRIKPDITVPGSSIVSASADVNVNVPGNCGTSSKSGTSMSSPGGAGLAALAREYFTAGWYPSASPTPGDAFTPSAALIKATLVNSAVSMTNEAPIPSNHQGWGRVLLDNVLEFPADTRKLWVKDETTGFSLGSSGAETSFQFSVSAGEPFKVTLAWVDFPSTPAANPHINNDLDLRVEGPDGTYLGNVFAGGQSVTGGSSNRLDTVEQVLVASPTPGLYTVVVSSFNVPDGPQQPFGLVVTGAMSEEGNCSSIPASAAVESAGLTFTSGDGDDFLDNCENADLSLSITNDGGVDLTNVRITSIGSPSHPAVAFHDALPIAVASPIAAGCGGPRGSSTASFNFTARGLAHDEVLVFEVEIDADELISPITAILTISDLEVDLELVPETHFDFEDSTEAWQVVRGTFDRTNTPPPGAEATSFYFASSSATSDQCDQVRSPRLRLTSTSTLTLWNQFGTEPGSPALGFYDRANAGLVDADTGVRVTIEPDGGLRPYNVPAGTPAGSCVTENQAGWAGPGPGWLDASWSASALGVASLPAGGGEFFLDIAYGTDALVEGTGFWFDQVTITDVLAHAEDASSDVCVGINNGPHAEGGGIFTEQNTSAPITLTADDPDGDPLFFTMVTPPANGSLSGTPPSVAYTPATDFVGPDAFTYEACDAELCDLAEITITVIPAGIPIPCTAGFAGAYPCSNVDLLGVMPSGVLVGGTGNPSSGSDLWGWTDPLTGREYAVQGLSNSVAFVDVTAPTEPVFVGHLPAPVPNVLWRDLKVYNNHAYIVGDFSPLAHGDAGHPEGPTRPDHHGIQIFDLTRLRGAGPAEIFTHDAVYLGPPGQPSLLLDETHNIVINEETGFAYAVASNTCGGGLHMLDLKNDPLVPDFVGCFDDAGINVHDAQCVIYTGPDLDHQGKEICMNANEDFFDIVDVTDKNAPVRLARRTYFGQSYIHQGWFTEDQAYFISGDETDELFNGPHNTHTYIWDVRDLDNPLFINTYLGPTLAIDHNIYIRSCFVFQANYSAGLRVLDSSDVANGNLSEIGFFDTHAEDGGVDLTVFAGAWSNYPFFASGNVIVGNIEDGNLFILRPHLKPKAKDQEITTPEDTAVAITLEAEDINQQILSWSIVSGPDHGTLSGTAPDLVYTPDPDYNGPDSFVFEACDPDGLCDQGTVSITVTPVNDAPVANDDSYATAINTNLMVAAPGVLANDNDVDGDSLSATLVSTTGSGVLVLMSDGGFAYTPNMGSCGFDDTFTYTAGDGALDSNVATVSIRVTCDGDNQPPTAADQVVETDEDMPVPITLTGSDPDGDSLYFSVISGPSNGMLSGTAPNATYTPNADFNGSDLFTFQVCDRPQGDPDRLCDQGTVTITVTSINDAPTAADDAYAANEGETLSISAPGVLGNDGDVDGDSLLATLASDVSNGTLMLAADGSFTYTPDAGFCGADDSFTYRANDGNADSNLATVTIAVSCGPNRAPTADDQSVSTGEDTAIAITLTGSDPDGDPLTYAAVDRPANGMLSGTPPSLVYTPDPDYNGPDSFTFEVCDAEFCDSATVSITVRPVNDFPVANDDAGSTSESTPVTIDVLANDTDVDGDTLTVGSVTQGANGTVTNNGTDVTYEPNPGFSGTDGFNYVACDPSNACDNATVTVTVDPIVQPCPPDDDDDFDSDGVLDDIDSDDDSDGIPDDADSDDDNDGDSDNSDSDDDNDCIDDEFDSQGFHEDQSKSSGNAPANGSTSYPLQVDGLAMFLVELVEGPGADALSVQIHNPAGGLVALSTPSTGRSLATAVPGAPGIYTVTITNPTATSISFTRTSITRRAW